MAPGDLAAWDPTTDTWTSLPRAPSGAEGASIFWTGHELLVWGDTSGPDASRHVGERYVPAG